VVAMVAALAAPAPDSAGAELSGPARAIDGDTLEINGVRLRLHGIDAPELAQRCHRDGRPWLCGPLAASALRDRIGSQVVTCRVLDRDRYGRSIAVCRTAGGEDLAAWLVARGWALAWRHYATDYVAEEEAAKAAGRGIWNSLFVPPWKWRRKTRPQNRGESGRRSGQCRIKGNISSRTGERIYHMPGGRYYDATRIAPGRGERWFCSEREARQAGWRRSKR